MTDEQKITTIVALLPVFGDLLQDIEPVLHKELRQKHTDNLIYKIRKFDKAIMDHASAETTEQQILMQRAFRQWIELVYQKQNIDEPETSTDILKDM